MDSIGSKYRLPARIIGYLDCLVCVILLITLGVYTILEIVHGDQSARLWFVWPLYVLGYVVIAVELLVALKLVVATDTMRDTKDAMDKVVLWVACNFVLLIFSMAIFFSRKQWIGLGLLILRVGCIYIVGEFGWHLYYVLLPSTRPPPPKSTRQMMRARRH